jgi:HAD superfamily hydrolase (TIGR01509 family)
MAGALIFDIDGTLLQSDPLHEAVFRELFAEYGVTLGEDDYRDHILGRQNLVTMKHFLPGQDALSLDLEKERRFRARLGASVPPTRGLRDLLTYASAHGVPCAVVTNAARANADAMLGAIGLANRFQVIVVEGDAPRPKPAPDPYLLAVRRLGTDPSRCIVFEDSVPGVTAGAAAGLFTVGMRSSLGDAELRAAGASATIEDFADPALAPLLARLHGAAA